MHFLFISLSCRSFFQVFCPYISYQYRFSCFVKPIDRNIPIKSHREVLEIYRVSSFRGTNRGTQQDSKDSKASTICLTWPQPQRHAKRDTHIAPRKMQESCWLSIAWQGAIQFQWLRATFVERCLAAGVLLFCKPWLLFAIEISMLRWCSLVRAREVMLLLSVFPWLLRTIDVPRVKFSTRKSK